MTAVTADAEAEADAAVDVEAAVNIIRNQFIHPPIQCPLFVDCVGCPSTISVG